MKLKKLNVLIRKWKSLSSQSRSGHCSSSNEEERRKETVYVGSSRRRYVIDTNYLKHPLINALIEKSRKDGDESEHGAHETEGEERVSIKCEVVLFDHLLWMLENADPDSLDPDQSLEDLAELYSSENCDLVRMNE